MKRAEKEEIAPIGENEKYLLLQLNSCFFPSNYLKKLFCTKEYIIGKHNNDNKNEEVLQQNIIHFIIILSVC